MNTKHTRNGKTEEGGVKRPTILKNAGSSYFSAVDLESREVLARLGDGTYPHTAHFHPDMPLVYLLYISSAHLEVVDLRSYETVQRVDEVGTTPVGSTFVPDEDLLFVGTAVDLPESEEPGVLTFRVGEDGELESTGETPVGRCSGMRSGPDGRVYTGLKRSDEIAALTIEDEPVVENRFPTGEAPHDIYVLPEDGALVVNNSGEFSATFIDISDDEIICEAETGENPHGFAVADSAEYKYGLFPARDEKRVGIVDIEAAVAGEPDPTEKLLDLGTTTGFAGATPDGRYAVFDSYDHEYVTIVDLEELSVDGQVEIGGEPLHVVFSDDGDRCYVGNMVENYVAILDTSPLGNQRPGDVEVIDRITGLGEQPSGIFLPEVDS
jgi:DNA-binding beta-propeller fold protein YncE